MDRKSERRFSTWPRVCILFIFNFTKFYFINNFINSVKTVKTQSENAFKEIGKILKMRRYCDDNRVHKSRIESLKTLNSTNSIDDDDDFDPADYNPDLFKKLEENKKIAEDKEKKVCFNYNTKFKTLYSISSCFYS